MRIAIFTDTYTPQINGVVTSIQTFRAELERLGHSVHIFAPAARGAPEEENVHRIRSFTFLPYPEYRISVPMPKLIDEFEKIGADIIHVQSPVSVGATGIGLAKHFNLPVVGTFHTLLPEYMHYIVKGRLRKLFIAPARRFAWNWCTWFYNRCDVVVAPSEGIAKVLKGKGIKRPIRIIPTGLAPVMKASKKAAQTFRKKHDLKGKIILHVGRVTHEKNIDAIIDSIEKLPDVTLAIASDGPYRSELETRVKKKAVANRVRFLGYLSKTDLQAAYAAADIFVCASKSETQGIVLLEAAVSGLPVVTLNAPVVSDFVQENKIGLVANENNFAEIMQRALADKKLRQRVKNRASQIERKYRIEHCTKTLLEAYAVASLKRTKN